LHRISTRVASPLHPAVAIPGCPRALPNRVSYDVGGQKICPHMVLILELSSSLRLRAKFRINFMH
jgi:hypothetical protein